MVRVPRKRCGAPLPHRSLRARTVALVILAALRDLLGAHVSVVLAGCEWRNGCRVFTDRFSGPAHLDGPQDAGVTLRSGEGARCPAHDRGTGGPHSPGYANVD